MTLLFVWNPSGVPLLTRAWLLCIYNVVVHILQCHRQNHSPKSNRNHSTTHGILSYKFRFQKIILEVFARFFSATSGSFIFSTTRVTSSTKVTKDSTTTTPIRNAESLFITSESFWKCYAGLEPPNPCWARITNELKLNTETIHLMLHDILYKYKKIIPTRQN